MARADAGVEALLAGELGAPGPVNVSDYFELRWSAQPAAALRALTGREVDDGVAIGGGEHRLLLELRNWPADEVGDVHVLAGRMQAYVGVHHDAGGPIFGFVRSGCCLCACARIAVNVARARAPQASRPLLASEWCRLCAWHAVGRADAVAANRQRYGAVRLGCGSS